VTDNREKLLAIEERRLRELDQEREATLARIAALRATRPVPAERSADEKLAIFQGLFRGRTDVFPRRWENSRSGRAGYAPACRNEWVSGVCEKPQVRCGACPNQAFEPLDEDAMLAHLRGRHVSGIYPLLENDTCWFCAVDLDGSSWREDAQAFRAAARDFGVAVSVERSRSGSGAHVWIFFSEPVPAIDARRLASGILTEATARRPSIGLASYDRLFPSQDVMPKGGFGNLIALPLQRAAREEDCSVFLDDDLVPFADQWTYLAGIQRIGRDQVELLVASASRRAGGILGVADETEHPDEPWRARSVDPPLSGPLPAQVRAVLAQQLYVEREGLPPRLYDRIRRLAAFANPVFYERQRLRLSTGRVPRLVACAEEHPQHVALPRGCQDDLAELLGEAGIELAIDDRRTTGSRINAAFAGTLTAEQRLAVDAMAADPTGVLVAPPGAGKTVMAAALIARRGVSTLIIVPSRALVEQWRARLAAFLELPPKSIGTIVGGRRKPTGTIDVATIQSLARGGEVDAAVDGYGFVVVDECHHVPAVSTEQVLRSIPARFVLGLTATPHRRDGHQPIIRMQCGPTRHAIRTRPNLTLRVIRRETATTATGASSEVGIQELYRLLAEDGRRNDAIVRDTLGALAEGRSPLILTVRRDHLECLKGLLAPHVERMAVLHGGLRPPERRAALAALALDDGPTLILATGRYLGEGFDHPKLDTLLLALPVAWKGTLTQYAGRLHRPAEGKSDALIYDYVDVAIPMLDRMYVKRERTYRALGYQVGAETPALALV
jgi:superfamily II DNA or RNA helicase